VVNATQDQENLDLENRSMGTVKQASCHKTLTGNEKSLGGIPVFPVGNHELVTESRVNDRVLWSNRAVKSRHMIEEMAALAARATEDDNKSRLKQIDVMMSYCSELEAQAT